MFERFTGTARHVVVQAQADARRLGHNYIGCEHLLLAAVAAAEPASAVLRDHGVTPERVEAEILRTIGRGQTVDPLGCLDREALAFIGIDVDVVRARIEAAFGPDALTGPLPAASPGEGPASRADAPPSRPSPQSPANRPARQRLASAGPASPWPYPVHATREEEPGALAPRGEGAARQLHRGRAPHPGPAGTEGRHGTGDHFGPRRTGHIAARRHPRPLPQGELIRTPTCPPLPQAFQRGPDSADSHRRIFQIRRQPRALVLRRALHTRTPSAGSNQRVSVTRLTSAARFSAVHADNSIPSRMAQILRQSGPLAAVAHTVPNVQSGNCSRRRATSEG
jgi:hypothetical protein